MPIYESSCQNPACERAGSIWEWFTWNSSSLDPDCGDCGQRMVRMASRFAVTFTGVISHAKYNDPKSEPYGKDGHMMFRRESSKSGLPEPVWIETWEDQRKFCKEEGIGNPTDLPTNAQISPDGRKWETAGMPGQWV